METKVKGIAVMLFGIVFSLPSGQSGGAWTWHIGLILAFIGLIIVFWGGKPKNKDDLGENPHKL